MHLLKHTNRKGTGTLISDTWYKPHAIRELASNDLQYLRHRLRDHSRVGFVQMHPDEGKLSATAFLKATVAHHAALGVKIKRLLTDNGSAYRSRLFAKTCLQLNT